MRALRGLWRLGCAVLHGLHGVAIVLLRFPSLDRGGRRERVRWWADKMLRLLGLRLQVDGSFRPGAKMIAANHVSWLDILAVHAVCPEARFVSKAEVRHWPLVGRLVDAGDSLYIERHRKRDALRVVHQSAEALQAGDTVAVFPEGTTGDGRALLPFHANLLQAAIATGTPIQPVALSYSQPGHDVSPAVAWLGDTTLLSSVWTIAMADGLGVRVTALSPQGSEHADRRALADRLMQLITAAMPR